MSERRATAVPSQSANGTRASHVTSAQRADLLAWPAGTVLPDEMIAQLRETLGALDALLASAEQGDAAPE